MSLRNAILGYLSTGPGTGWDLSRQFDTGLGWFWTARHSQIYPELKRMTQDGLVTRDSETVGESLERFTYSITDLGRQALAEFTRSPPSFPPNRDPERLQLIFADDTPDSLRPHLVAHREHHARRREQLLQILESLHEHTHKRFNLRVASRPAEGRLLTLGLRELAYRGEVDRAELEISWADNALTWLEANLPSSSSTAAARPSAVPASPDQADHTSGGSDRGRPLLCAPEGGRPGPVVQASANITSLSPQVSVQRRLTD